jgi:hypothetical protein
MLMKKIIVGFVSLMLVFGFAFAPRAQVHASYDCAYWANEAIIDTVLAGLYYYGGNKDAGDAYTAAANDAMLMYQNLGCDGAGGILG